MKVENQVQPSPNSIREFIAVEGPLMMVNLLKFREKAAYADGQLNLTCKQGPIA